MRNKCFGLYKNKILFLCYEILTKVLIILKFSIGYLEIWFTKIAQATRDCTSSISKEKTKIKFCRIALKIFSYIRLYEKIPY